MTAASVIAVVAIIALLYWLLVATEGTYLGPRIVTLLYDWTAPRYDRIKDLRFIYEMQRLGIPLAEALEVGPSPRVLDVATGTGRLPLALLRQTDFCGRVVGLDRSGPMLAQARKATNGYDRLVLLQADAGALPFAGKSFDAVTCLEALEFMWDPAAVIREMGRVLRPGGVLLVSSRVGLDARLLPGRLCGRGKMERFLRRTGFEAIETERWQIHYDLIWARKAPIAGT
jgi:ubiquinone/menaquinone biosynthesis C-methylase UbiE